MIEFKEGQEKIFVGKHKLTKSSYQGWLDFHLVYSADEKSGYGDIIKGKFIATKFVRIISFENTYDFETIKNLATTNFEDELQGINYFENGGYVFDKKLF